MAVLKKGKPIVQTPVPKKCGGGKAKGKVKK
jgi:hypothetical protein